MSWRVACVFVLATWLAGCADNRLISGANGFLTETPDPATVSTADPSFRVGELKTGMSKAELLALYPNRMVAGGKFGPNQYYYVEPPGLTTGSKVQRDRLELFLNDGKLAAYGLLRSQSEVMGATELGDLPVVASASEPEPPKLELPKGSKAKPPGGKYAVQIGARRSEAEARALIEEMRAKYPRLLGRQWAEIHRVDLPQGSTYRVMVGPLATSQQATQLCDGLKAQGAECFLRGT